MQSIIRQLFDAPPAVLSASARADLIASLTSSPSLSSLTSSDDGVLALCQCVSHGTAKDRKQVMRGIKGEVPAAVPQRAWTSATDTHRAAGGRHGRSGEDTSGVAVLADPFTLSQLLMSVQGSEGAAGTAGRRQGQGGDGRVISCGDSEQRSRGQTAVSTASPSPPQTISGVATSPR